jgi:photosystem II stability/assembly factor-like uncharacterized protein
MKTVDGGLNWKELSPDITGKDGRGVVYTIAPSPLRAEVVWAGSDTGHVHVTRDGGTTWSEVTPPGVSEWSKITLIEASHFDPAVAYAAIDRHRLDDYKPYIFRTRDFGKTWTPVTSGLAEPAFLNAVREDTERRGLLFAGTETGVYVSFNDGDAWEPLQLNLPVTSVRDLAIHGDDLVIATHGRSFWIMDNITPLRQTAQGDVFLYKPATAIRITSEEFQGTPLPPEMPTAKNPPDGAVIDFHLANAVEEVTLEILKGNEVFRKISSRDQPREPRMGQGIADYWKAAPEKLSTGAGLNRFVWDVHYNDPGPMAPPGAYTVRLTVAGKSYTQPLIVKMDPRSTATPTELSQQFELGLKISQALARSKDSREVAALLNAALGVVNSADRTPPAVAYKMYEEAMAKLK